MNTRTIIYTSDIVDGKVFIKNTENDSISSDNPQEILGFLAKNYTADRNRKLTWNLDIFLSVCFRQLGIDVCRDLADTTKKRVKYGIYEIFYNRGTNFSVKSDNVQWPSWYYNLSQYFEDEKDTDIKDLNVILAKANELINAFTEMGLEPIALSSPISVWEKSVLKTMKVPTLVDIHLPADQLDDFLNMVEECRLGREWIEAYGLGKWEATETYNYDVQSSYGFNLSQVLDYSYASFWKSDKPDKTADDGVLQGTVTIFDNVRYSPICYNDNGKTVHPIASTWPDVLTLSEIRWIYRKGIGKFEMEYGYLWKYDKTKPKNKPFEIPLSRVFNMRQKGGLVKKLAKRIGAAAHGKLLQPTLPSGDANLYYSPILGMQTTVAARLQTADFIYDNKLNEGDWLIHIATDSVRSLKYVPIQTKVEMGAWKLNMPAPVIIISPGLEFTSDKNPQGWTYGDVVEAIQNKPNETIYDKVITRRRTLAEAVAINDLSKVGELADFPHTIDINVARLNQKCDFSEYPDVGGDLLKHKYYGKAVKI